MRTDLRRADPATGARPTGTDAAGFEDRLSRLKGVARGGQKMAVSIHDKVEADSRPRKNLLSRLAFPLLVRGVAVPALFLTLYYTFVAPPKPVSLAGNSPEADALLPSQITSAQGTAQP